MQLKGKLVHWTIKSNTELDRATVEKHLAALGKLAQAQAPGQKTNSKTPRTFVDLMKRNDYKASLLRALRKVLKKDEGERFYRRLEDVKERMVVAVILPVYEKQDGVPDYDITKEVIVTLQKGSGVVTFGAESPFNASILDTYRRMQKTSDSAEIGALLRAVIDTECFGVPYKSGSGIYYVPDHHTDQIKKLEAIANILPGDTCRVYAVPAYNEPSTNEAVQDAVYEEMNSRLETFRQEVIKMDKGARKKFHDNEDSKAKIDNREVEAKNLRARVRAYQADLSGRTAELEDRLNAMEKALVTAGKKATFNLTDAFNNL